MKKDEKNSGRTEKTGRDTVGEGETNPHLNIRETGRERNKEPQDSQHVPYHLIVPFRTQDSKNANAAVTRR